MATTDRAPPDVRVPEGWERTASAAETLFDARVVTVRAHTVVFEDVRLREAVRDRTGVDGTWRFFFASRLRLSPDTGGSKALNALVADRANDGFVDRLRERGFRDVREDESRRFRVGRAEADLTRYRAAVDAVDGARDDESGAQGATDGDAAGAEPTVVTAEAYLAAWPDDGAFLVAGGAYPVSVDGALSAALTPSLAPERHREALFGMIRSVE